MRGRSKNAGLAIQVLVALIAWGCTGATAAGDYVGRMNWDGYERTWLAHVPANLPQDVSPPLMLVLHGGGGTAQGMVTLTKGGLNRLADRDGFIVVYPQGYDKHWNDGRKGAWDRAHLKKIDDVGFISALIDRMIAEHRVDPRRVYLTGISNGGMMSYRLACSLSPKIAAIAPVASSMSVDMPRSCSATAPVSLLVISGVDDPLVPFDGGDVQVGWLKRGKVISVYDSIRYWLGNNGCSTKPAITNLPDVDPGDGTTVRLEDYGAGRNGSRVAAYIIDGGGHTWPGGRQYLWERIIGKTSRDIDANEVIWEFCKKISR
ncbi:MAG: PHB depolymerase family esterase [Acidobacteriota bacterium]